jgi:hypothetical protein
MPVDTLLLDNSLWNLLIRFFINLLVLFILVGVIYYRYSRKEEYLFSFILLGVMIFLISSILGSKEIQMGLALGIFAIFSIIRFRTVPFSVKDITYVFIIIGLSVINSQANIAPYILGAFIVNFSVIMLTYMLEIFLKRTKIKKFNKLILVYNNIEMLIPERNKDLLAELSAKTGRTVEKVIIQKINIGRNDADIEIFFMDTTK